MKRMKGELSQEYADLVKPQNDTIDELKGRVEILESRVDWLEATDNNNNNNQPRRKVSDIQCQNF